MNLKGSLLKTIAFYDLFDFPLTAEEIKERLFQYNKPIHIKEVKGTLIQMVEAETLETLKGYYVLSGRIKIVSTRNARKFIAEKFWNRVKLYSKTLQRIPFIKMVAVCNNLAYDNVGESSDIDLFIVTKPSRMWMTRLMITMILHFFGVRRHGKHVAGRFCLSFFVTTNKMNIGELQIEPQDPYLAYWTQNLTPIYGEETYEEFKRINESWLKKQYGLKFLESSKRHLCPLKESRFKLFIERILKGRLGHWKENFIKKILKTKTLAHQKHLEPDTGVVVTDDMLKFHDKDRRREFLERWKKKLKIEHISCSTNLSPVTPHPPSQSSV